MEQLAQKDPSELTPEERAALKKQREKEKKKAKKAAAKAATADDGQDGDTTASQAKKDTEAPKKKEAEGAKKKADAAKGKDAKGKDAKKPKAGPGAKQLAQMKEYLAKLKEEEERAKKEEEERLRKEEEERLRKEEELRKLEEIKQKKKDQKKARIERLKKEGKWLNEKQKEKQRRALQSIEMMKKLGVKVPAKDGAKPNATTPTAPKPQPAKKKKPTVPKAGDAPQSQTEKKEVSNGPKAQEREPEGKADSEEPEILDAPDESDEVVENWEEISTDEIDSSDVSLSDEEGSSEEDSSEKENEEKSQPPESKDKKSSTVAPSNDKGRPAPANKSDSKTQPAHPKTVSKEEKPPLEKSFRSPIICVLGHVDTGKTKLLDYVRHTHVQEGEAGGITQQIGATFVPPVAIHEQTKGVSEPVELKVPGLLIIDTPGHESFTNLRSRGSSLCDIAILVIDIMHGLEPQTLESINLLKARKTPFVVALNKIDRLNGWKSKPKEDIEKLISQQSPRTIQHFNERLRITITQLAEQGLNAEVYYKNPDPRTYVSLVPTSAVSGDGMGNLISLLIKFSQTMIAKKIEFNPDELNASVLEVKQLPGLGTTIDVIIVNGQLKEGDKIILAGHEGPIVTSIRAILVPQPLRELRVKSPYQELKTVQGAMGVKITGHDLEKAIAGLSIHVAKNEADVERLTRYCMEEFGQAMRSIKCSERGVHVQASTLGSLEALLEFLKQSKIPYCSVRIGPVVKRDVMKVSTMLEIAPEYALILAFDVNIERDAQQLADQLKIRIFQAEIIYHLFDMFTQYQDEQKKKKKEQFKSQAIFPCKLRILPQFVFNTRDPIVLGVCVEDGILLPGTPLAVPSKENINIGSVSTIERDHKAVNEARRGHEVCIKIENTTGEAPKLYGRHFDHEDLLVSRISRESIDICKEYFRDDLAKPEWALMIELKKVFEII